MLDLWLPYTKEIDPDAHVLFCFPYAGGNPAFYNNLQVYLPDVLQICPIQLPGRGVRFTEASYTDFHTLIRDIIAALQPHLPDSFSFFGHSMGALVSFEVTRLLHKMGLATPDFLFVSSYHAPQLPKPGKQLHHLPDKEFLDGIVAMNGLPAELVENRELLSVFLPALRADFTMCETYQFQSSEKIPSDIVALGGKDDPEAGEEHLRPWAELTSGNFFIHMLDGDHFYIHRREAEVSKIIENRCRTLYF